MLTPLTSVPELQALDKDIRKSAYRYAHLRRMKHWEYYTTIIIGIAVGIFLAGFIPNVVYLSLATGINVGVIMIVSDYATRSIFRSYVIKYLKTLESSELIKSP